MHLNEFNTIFLRVAVLSVVIAMVKYGIGLFRGRTAEGKIRDRMRKKTLLPGKLLQDDRFRRVLLLLIFVFALAIRLWQFGQIPGGVNQDEAMAAVDGKAIADYGTDRLGTFLPAHLYGWGYGQMSALLSYLVAIFVKIGGLNAVTARLPLLVMSMVGGIFFYLLMRDLFGKDVGLAAALFVAVDPWHYMQSRWAIDCNLLPHFFMGAMYFLNRGLREKNRRKRIFLGVSMVFFGLCMYCYGVTLYTLPPLLLVMAVYYMARKRLKIGDVLLCVGVYLLVAWPFLLTMAVNYFKWDTIRLPFVTIPYFPESIRSQDILFFSEHPLAQLKDNIRSLLNVALYQKKDLAWNDIEGFGTVYLCSMPFAFAGILEFLRSRSEGMKSLAVFALGAGVWVGLCTRNVNVNRVNLIFYGIMMFTVLGISFTIREISAFAWTNLGMYAVLAGLFLAAYFGDYVDLISVQFYGGFGEALMRAEESGTARIYITDNTQDKGRYQTSEILTLFYDGTDAKYFQGLTNINKGEECLPYRERFVYADISKQFAKETRKEDASYVVRAEEAECFSRKRYEVMTYGRYSAVIPKETASESSFP